VHRRRMRHTFADELRAAGVDEVVISKLLGDFSIAVTSRYLDHLTNDRAIAALAAVELPALGEQGTFALWRQRFDVVLAAVGDEGVKLQPLEEWASARFAAYAAITGVSEPRRWSPGSTSRRRPCHLLCQGHWHQGSRRRVSCKGSRHT
jgi:hypothetical protein